MLRRDAEFLRRRNSTNDGLQSGRILGVQARRVHARTVNSPYRLLWKKRCVLAQACVKAPPAAGEDEGRGALAAEDAPWDGRHATSLEIHG